MCAQQLNDAVSWYMGGLTARVVAASGRATDRHHLGKVIMQCFRDDPDFICQIDAGTDESETNGSMLRRSVQCALLLRSLGLRRGDVAVLLAPNHLRLAAPFYAGLYLGLAVAPVDRTLKVDELKHTFKSYKPAVVFCQCEKKADVQTVLEALGQSAAVITFDRDHDDACFDDLLTADDEEINNFKVEEFDPEETIAIILPTSGSTGFPKGAAATHSTWIIAAPQIWARSTTFPTPSARSLVASPLQWLSAANVFVIGPLLKTTRVQTSQPVTIPHLRHIMDTYKPTYAVFSPTMMGRVLQERPPLPLASLQLLLLGGSAVHQDLVHEIQRHAPDVTVMNAFGLSELCTVAFNGPCPAAACGARTLIHQYRLVDIDTMEDITEPNVNGELWIKGPMFREYYNEPATTAAAFSDGWFRTGDLFYRDRHHYYYFVERIKLLLKYNSYQISPVEIESVIRTLSGVADVAVTSVRDERRGELPAAAVIRRAGAALSAHDVQRLVSEKLSDAKQLRGGVFFVSEFPQTASTKLHRGRLRDLVERMRRL